MEPDQILAGCIHVYRNAWISPSREGKWLDDLGDRYWEPATTITKIADYGVRTNLVINLQESIEKTNNLSLTNISNKFRYLLDASAPGYAAKYDVDGYWHEEYRALKYSNGAEFKTHYDGSTITHRAISAIVYLNDDYEGGEIEFTNFDIKIKPEAGMLLLFPSNYAYTHIAHPVTSGTKYALVTWMHDQPIDTSLG